MTIDITTRNLLIGLCSHMAYMQGQLEALHQLDDPDDHYWFRESVALQQKVADHLAAMADRPAVPAPPADGEVAALVRTLTGIAHWRRRGRPGECDPSPFDIRQADRLDRAAELLQRQALVPVSVSERPWEREGWCDAEGKCWIRGKVEGDWRLINPTNSGVPNLKYCFTHCLPAHALPLPEVDK